MNYQEELYSILENNEFRTLPSQELIDNDERIAKAVWYNYIENFRSEYDGDSFEKFKTIKWDEILRNYKNNIDFWQSLNISYELKNDDFKKMFPLVTNTILNDNEKLLILFEKTNDIFYFNHLKISNEEKERIYRNYLLENTYEITKEYIDSHKEDRRLFINIAYKNKYIYEMLPDIYKNDEEFIKIICNDFKYASKILSEENKEKYIKYWLYSNANRLSYSELKLLDDYKLDKVLSLINDDNRIIVLYEQIGNRVKNALELVLERNTALVVQNLNINTLKKYYDKNHNEHIDKYLNNWIDNFKIKELQNKDNKHIELIKMRDSLNLKLLNNFNYNTSVTIKNKQIDYNYFEEIYKNCKEEINKGSMNYDEANQSLLMVKSRLQIDVLKEKRLPKNNLMQYLESIELQEKLMSNQTKNKKHKI